MDIGESTDISGGLLDAGCAIWEDEGAFTWDMRPAKKAIVPGSTSV